MNRPPLDEAEALHHLVEDLRGMQRYAAAAIVDAGMRALAGAVEHELREVHRDDPVTAAMVRAWGMGYPGAVLAGYRSLYAPGTDGNADAALTAISVDAIQTDLARGAAARAASASGEQPS